MSATNYRKEKDCLNCGHIVEDKFCSACGQENIVVKEKAMHMVIHAIADYFHFENKFFGTLKPLLFKPGILTKLYVDGKRASFLHPVKLYIFVSIVFFISVLKVNTDSEKSKSAEKQAKDSVTVENVIKALGVDKKETSDSATVSNIINALEANEDSATATGSKYTSKYSSKIVSKSLGKINDSSINRDWVLDTDTTYEAYLNRVSKFPKADQPGMFKKYMAKNGIKFKAKDSRKVFLESFVKNIPKMMFVLLPLFAIMLHLFYWRKKKFYYEDLIYSFHLHSLIFLSLLIAKFANWIIGFATDISEYINFLIWIYIIWYIYRSLRTFYGSSRWITVFKMFLLFIGYMLLLGLCFTILAFITVIMQ